VSKEQHLSKVQVRIFVIVEFSFALLIDGYIAKSIILYKMKGLKVRSAAFDLIKKKKKKRK
jgi:hypothetical protein